MMKWDEIDIRLRELYNLVSTSFSETVSYNTATKAGEKAFKIMEELTNELKNKNKKCAFCGCEDRNHSQECEVYYKSGYGIR